MNARRFLIFATVGLILALGFARPAAARGAPPSHALPPHLVAAEPSPSAPPDVSRSPAPERQLPATGARVGPLAVLGVCVLVAGLLLLRAGRQRRIDFWVD